MKRNTKDHSTLSMIFGIFLIAGLCYLAWIVFSRLVEFLEKADPSVAAAVVGAIATILVSIGVVYYSNTQIKRREIEESHRPQKIEIYSEFLTIIAQMIGSSIPNLNVTPLPEKELATFLFEFKTKLILWASPKVIDADQKFERVTQTDESDILVAVDELYCEIREDIGLSNRGLNKHQLIKMFMKSPEELDQALKKTTE